MLKRTETANGVRLVSKPFESAELRADIRHGSSPKVEIVAPRDILGPQDLNIWCNATIAFRDACLAEWAKVKKKA